MVQLTRRLKHMALLWMLNIRRVLTSRFVIKKRCRLLQDLQQYRRLWPTTFTHLFFSVITPMKRLLLCKFVGSGSFRPHPSFCNTHAHHAHRSPSRLSGRSLGSHIQLLLQGVSLYHGPHLSHIRGSQTAVNTDSQTGRKQTGDFDVISHS